jgi:DNA-binding MarR family transcriptional regulator
MEKKKTIIGKMIKNNIMHKRIVEKRLEKTGVFQGQHRILMELSALKYDSQKDIAKAMNISTATITVALKKLEKGGFIKRNIDDFDNRLNKIEITEKGMEAVDSSREIFKKLDNEVLAGFSEEEMDNLLNYLEKIESNLKNIEGGKFSEL